MRVVVDTNVAFSALAAGCGDLAMRLLSPAGTDFYAPRFLFIELFKHKARLVAATARAGEQFYLRLKVVVEPFQHLPPMVQKAACPPGVS